jgi:hypothetical protein
MKLTIIPSESSDGRHVYFLMSKVKRRSLNTFKNAFIFSTKLNSEAVKILTRLDFLMQLRSIKLKLIDEFFWVVSLFY